jgi:Tol biopolymer transport system component
MNKDLHNQLAADEQPMASKLESIAEDMQLSPTFQWELETQLMDRAKAITQPSRGWQAKIFAPLGWATLALGIVFLLNWTIRSLAFHSTPAAGETPSPEISFESNVRQGNICAGPLALVHGFELFLTTQDKGEFVVIDEQKTIGEFRSLSWSRDGLQLAVVGNTAGNGNIYLLDPAENQLQPLLSNSELGYLMDTAWSWNGKQLVAWSSQNNSVVYLINADGSGFVESERLGVVIFGPPQFSPDGESIIVYSGPESSLDGLHQPSLDGSAVRIVNPLVKNPTGFTWSPDGTRLAYVEMHRDLGEARLVLEEMATGRKVVLGTLPIPKGSGSSIPEAANLNWSPEGSALVFEFGRSAADRAIYLAYADGAGLIKLADSAHAPTISGDGKCLAYISDKQVFLLDLSNVSQNSAPNPVRLADLPTGRSIASFLLDKLQWRPGTTP